MSSKNHEMISDAGVEERGRETSGLGIAIVVRGSYCTLTGQLEVHEPGSERPESIKIQDVREIVFL